MYLLEYHAHGLSYFIHRNNNTVSMVTSSIWDCSVQKFRLRWQVHLFLLCVYTCCFQNHLIVVLHVRVHCMYTSCFHIPLPLVYIISLHACQIQTHLTKTARLKHCSVYIHIYNSSRNPLYRQAECPWLQGPGKRGTYECAITSDPITQCKRTWYRSHDGCLLAGWSRCSCYICMDIINA